MTPNGIPDSPTLATRPSDAYNKAWCDERHDRLDGGINDLKARDEKLETMFDGFREKLDVRLGKTERKVATYSGGMAVLVLIIEALSKVLW